MEERFGQVTEVFDYGSLMIWDLQNKHEFPAYPSKNVFQVADLVTFILDNESVAINLNRINNTQLPEGIEPLLQ